MRIGLATSHIDTTFRGFIAQLQLCVAQGDLVGAEATIRAMDEAIPRTTVPQVELLLGATRAQALDAVLLTLAQIEVETGRP